MEIKVFIAVLIAALVHALWNGMVKVHKNKYIAVSAIVLGHVPLCLIVVLITPMPSMDSVPYIVASARIHQGYQWFLLSAYKVGDSTKVYPVARGTGPVVVTIIAITFLNTSLSNFELLGILLISLGIFSLAFKYRTSKKNKKGIYLAIWTGIFIGGYSLVDGTGARISGSPLSYMSWAFILNAMIFPFLLSFFNQRYILKKTLKDAPNLFWIGGTASSVVYLIIVWAYTQAPIPLVSALRETSVILAILIGYILLKEKLTIYKIISILIIFFGILSLKFF